jgi:hypothetical protein
MDFWYYIEPEGTDGGEAHIEPICIIQRSWISGTTLNLKGLMAGRCASSLFALFKDYGFLVVTTLN